MGATMKNLPIERVVNQLLKSSAVLNGNARKWGIPAFLDGNTEERKDIEKAMNEIIRRYRAKPSLAEHSALKPVIEAVKNLPDIEDVDAVAKAVKGLELIPENKIGPTNPFVPR